jgi:iron complex transport system ATP-binding protein
VTSGPIVALSDVTVRIGGATLLDRVTLQVAERDHLVLLGPNGSGKTTLLRVVAGYRFPTAGEVTVLGERLGRTDVRSLRRRVGVASTALDDLVEVAYPAAAIVAAAIDGATWPTPAEEADPVRRGRALTALDRVGAAHLADRPCRTLSQGERQRVMIARALVLEPELLLLDEPMVGLDVAARESLLDDLAAVMAEPTGPTVVLVTHHLEEVPPAATAAALLRDGALVAHGPARDVLTDGPLSAAFGLPLTVRQVDGRRWARRAR